MRSIVLLQCMQAPMEEMLGSFGGGLPNEAHLRLYREWAKGGWGMIITGASL